MGIAPPPISIETTLEKDDVAVAAAAREDNNHNYNMEEAKESNDLGSNTTKVRNGKKNSAAAAEAFAAATADDDKDKYENGTVRNMHENIPLTKQQKHDNNDIDTNREHHNVSEVHGKLPRGQSQLAYSVGGNTREGMLSNEGSV